MSRLLLLCSTVTLLVACAATPVPRPHEPVIGADLKAAFARDGLSVFADGCYQYKPVGADTFLRQDSQQIAAAILLSTVDRLHTHGIQERTHTAPLYCGMLINSIIDNARHAENRLATATRASPPYYSHPQIVQYPAALDAYLRLLRSVYGVVIQDSAGDDLPIIVRAVTLGLAGAVADHADRRKKEQAEASALENGVTETSAALLRQRLKARYVLMISDLERKTTGAARHAGPAVAVLTLGYSCLLSSPSADLCGGDVDASYTAAALVDLQERHIVWQNGGQTLDQTLAALLD